MLFLYLVSICVLFCYLRVDLHLNYKYNNLIPTNQFHFYFAFL